MRYGSVCSGIEAATAAWHQLGWQPSFFSEIEAFPRAVLQHHYPDAPLHGDFTTITANDYDPIELLVGGTPCQSFSVAGLRKGLDDPRGNLMLGYGALAKRLRPRWLVWENVPGVLSSNGGRDFGAFLGMLGELGYGFAYRVLDAQYLGVPQRRRRVFVVGCLGDWRSAAAVLFERQSLRRDHPPSRETGQEVAGTLSSRTGAGGGPGTDFEIAGGLQPVAPTLLAQGNQTGGTRPPGTTVDTCLSLIPVAQPYRVANYLTARTAKGMNSTLDEGQTPVLAIQNATRGKSQNGLGVAAPGDPMYTIDQASQHAVAVDVDTYNASITGDVAATVSAASGGSNTSGPKALVRSVHGTQDPIVGHQVAHALGRNNGAENALRLDMAVRRLTPRECERLQGFPDDWTKVPYRNKSAGHCPDGPRYKALGNSMAVPVMEWIGRRIELAEEITA